MKIKGLALVNEKEFPELTTLETDDPVEGQVIVDIEAAALNHRDVWITKGLYAGIKTPTILGSDGAGMVGDRSVVINPNIDWGSDEAFQNKSYNILGMPDHGTFADKVVVDEHKVFDKPLHLNMHEAAALPLGSMTAYRALFTKGKATENDTVLISGIGGGVAMFAFQFALANGATVAVTSSSKEKRKKAIDMGADAAYDYNKTDWHKDFMADLGGADVVIDGAGGDGFGSYPKLAYPGARLVIYGGTAGRLHNLSPQIIFWKQLRNHGIPPWLRMRNLKRC